MQAQTNAQKTAPDINQSPVKLTRREKEVLLEIVRGATNKEAANSLFCSKRTVDFHLNRIYRKLQAGNRIQAVRQARNLGLIPQSRI